MNPLALKAIIGGGGLVSLLAAFGAGYYVASRDAEERGLRADLTAYEDAITATIDDIGASGDALAAKAEAARERETALLKERERFSDAISTLPPLVGDACPASDDYVMRNQRLVAAANQFIAGAVPGRHDSDAGGDARPGLNAAAHD